MNWFAWLKRPEPDAAPVQRKQPANVEFLDLRDRWMMIEAELDYQLKTTGRLERKDWDWVIENNIRSDIERIAMRQAVQTWIRHKKAEGNGYT